VSDFLTSSCFGCCFNIARCRVRVPSDSLPPVFCRCSSSTRVQRHLHQFFPHLHQNLQEWRQRIFDFCSLISCKLPLPSCVIDIAFTDQSPNVRCLQCLRFVPSPFF
jgi:hypothetical protein